MYIVSAAKKQNSTCDFSCAVSCVVKGELQFSRLKEIFKGQKETFHVSRQCVCPSRQGIQIGKRGVGISSLIDMV